jgi:hypothetical protein
MDSNSDSSTKGTYGALTFLTKFATYLFLIESTYSVKDMSLKLSSKAFLWIFAVWTFASAPPVREASMRTTAERAEAEKFIVGVLCVLARSVLLFNGATRAVQCYLLCQKKKKREEGGVSTVCG